MGEIKKRKKKSLIKIKSKNNLHVMIRDQMDALKIEFQREKKNRIFVILIAYD